MLRCGFLLLMCSSLFYIACSTTVSHDGRALVIDGQRRVLFSGSIHYPRSTPEMWPDLIRKAKQGGLDAIETYVFWNGHEPRQREYKFEGNYDLIRFLKEVQNAGLYAILRIGPYVCAEWNYGGLPVWLHQIPGMQVRTDNQPWKVNYISNLKIVYLALPILCIPAILMFHILQNFFSTMKHEMQSFVTLIVHKIKEARLLATQGGPIILAQIENEYGNGDIEYHYGDAGAQYISWCAKMAGSLTSDVPWIMCQQADAPEPMINTCNGFAGCDAFEPNNANSPKIWTENWTGWFKNWGSSDPHRPVEDVAFQVALFFQSKGTLQNYYMYHGGTNFGRTSGPYIVTSYDYDAPLDEYGNIRQPKWGHLKELHASIKQMERALTYGEVDEQDLGNGLKVTKYSGNDVAPGCFLSNQNSTADATISFEGSNYFVPAWSVSILPDCKEETYNTAKVKAQTSLMVRKKENVEDQPEDLHWSWKPEELGGSAKKLGREFTANKLLEQKLATVDASDYLWYTTRVDVGEKESSFTLTVNTTGHVLYAFVNGKLIGSQYSTGKNDNFTFEREVIFNPGKNQISLLSAAVGLKNYGAYYDLTPVGIAGGPVKLVGENITLDLSNYSWSYKIGLDGEARKLYLDPPEEKWYSGAVPTKRPFTWYKTTFQAPLGAEPVAVDLLGLGRGAAWVNGNSVGRFWPSRTAQAHGCDSACDYRGSFGPSKCRTGCGEPSQRWYHVPRSFLRRGEPNTLILFEEAGGDPSGVGFRVVTVGAACAGADEGETLSLSCQGGRAISQVDFAGFGEVRGACGGFEGGGGCGADEAFAVVKAACLGKDSCSVEVTGELGKSCVGPGKPRKLVVQVTC